jgi:hypothetical protein
MVGLMGAILAVNRRTGYRLHVGHIGTDPPRGGSPDGIRPIKNPA